jgi:hypothetical protein
MSQIGTSLLLLSLVLADDKPEAKFPLSKETTYFVGPLDKDGYIDYEAALNERLGKGITAESNANVLIWHALGPVPEGEPGMPAKFFELLGIAEPPRDREYLIGLRAFLQDRLGCGEWFSACVRLCSLSMASPAESPTIHLIQSAEIGVICG